MYECPAYGGHGNDSHQSQHDLSHTYNYIDTPTSPKDKKSAETFTVYQCAAYGAQDQAVPPQDLAMGYSGITETGETVYNYVENSITDRGARWCLLSNLRNTGKIEMLMLLATAPRRI